jgi:hypothetical protein
MYIKCLRKEFFRGVKMRKNDLKGFTAAQLPGRYRNSMIVVVGRAFMPL